MAGLSRSLVVRIAPSPRGMITDGRSSPLASALVSAVRLDSTPPEPFAITTGPTSLVEAHAPGRPGVLDQ